MTRAIVCGGRDYGEHELGDPTNAARQEARVYQILDAAVERLGISEILHGACPTGADRWAAEWASRRHFPCRAFPADWDRHKRAAGPRRNALMLTESPDVIIAFPGGKGTADMVRQAEAAGVRVIKVDWK